MARFHRLFKIMALLTCGVATMWGAGSCLPYDFYANLLGDSIIATIVSTVAGSVATAATGG